MSPFAGRAPQPDRELMPTGEHPDVTSTLSDLERKLVDLERELNSVAGGSVLATAGAPTLPPTESGTGNAAVRVEDLRTEIADLVRFRDQLESAARELVTEYDRLVDRLRATDADASTPLPDAPSGPPSLGTPPVAAPFIPTPAAPAQALPAAVAAGMPGAPAATPQAGPSGGEHDQTSFVGPVVVDAGPFADITTLQGFEQGLARISGAEDVYVRSFEGDRALIDVRLSNPVPLVHLLRNQLPWPIIARETGSGRLAVDVVAADHHGI